MEKHIHINIGRQIGAGGLEVARELGKRLDIRVYDKELLTLAAKESGLDHSVFAREDEKDNLSMNTGFSFSSFAEAITNTFRPSVYNSNTIFTIQSQVIRRLAEEGSTIFVGRCADYVLRDFEGCISVFITSSMEDRIHRIRTINKYGDTQGVSDDKLADLLEKGDRKRASYYGDYTFKTWGAAESYDMCLSTSLLGVDGCADIIEETIRRRLL
ncbi:MAG: cytidylate kinase-like family protein [Bacteroidales bacterium]|nr:cytidylate kinase-like family protein [Bacteroidales bacterium]